MKRLLIITALYTGHGHKSISDALEERLAVYEDLEVRQIDGFDLMTKWEQICAERTYGPITRMPGKAWEVGYAVGNRLQEPLQKAIAAMIRTRFEALIREFRPDCILSVHPIFLKCIADLIHEMDLDIPFIAHEADPVDIAKFWFDPGIDLLLCPSRESYENTLKNFADASRVVEVGFPVRKRFMEAREQTAPERDLPGFTVTIMSGSEGSGLVLKITKKVLQQTDCSVNVICGRNAALRKKLKRQLRKRYAGRLNVHAFVEDIQNVMLASDALIMRASPNSVMEAVALNKPIVIFGQLAGQELHNPEMMERHGLAVVCRDTDQLPEILSRLQEDGGREAERLKACQRTYMPEDAAEKTAKLIYDYMSEHIRGREQRS